MKRILIVNVNWLGDVLFSTAVIRGLREKFPGAHIACMVVPRCREILDSNPRLNEIIIYDERGEHRGLLGTLRFIYRLSTKNFDTAILLHRSFTRALILFLAGIPLRIGYRTPKRTWLLTDALRPPAQLLLHRVDYYLNAAAPLGIDLANRQYEFFVSGRNRKKALALLEHEGIRHSDLLAALNPGGNWEPKRWPKEKFARLADELAGQLGVKVVITGSQRDAGLADGIASLAGKRPVNLCGRTTLKELACVFERANLVIANDSGPMHIGVAMGATTIALFGPTSPDITGPIGKGRFAVLHKSKGCEIPCYDTSCADYRCMEAITVEDVMKSARELLGF